MSHWRIVIMVAGVLGVLVALAVEQVRIPIGVPAMVMILVAAGVFERKAQ